MASLVAMLVQLQTHARYVTLNNDIFELSAVYIGRLSYDRRHAHRQPITCYCFSGKLEVTVGVSSIVSAVQSQ